MTRCAAIALGLVLAATHAGAAEKPAWDPKAAAQYLDGRAKWWLDWPSAARGQATACISCHTALPFALARPALARQLGETEAGPVEKRMLDGVRKRVENWEKIAVEKTAGKDPFQPFYGGQRKPSALGTETIVNALVLVNIDVRRAKGVLSDSTKKALGILWQQQQPNGAWLWIEFGMVPWEGDSAYYGAALAALAVGLAGTTYHEQADVQPKVAALKKYLTTQYPMQPLHHRMVTLWASSKLPGVLAEPAKKALIDEIVSTQDADGSWSSAKLGKNLAGKGGWTSHGGSQKEVGGDAYATGLAVLALKSTGLPADHPALKKGLAWLVAQQRGDWPATYLNRPRDPATDVGKFMRDAGAAYAVLALAD